MIRFNRLLLLMYVLYTPIFPQTKTDTTHTDKKIEDDKRQINSGTKHEILNEIKLLNGKFSVPLNLKIYQKVLLNDYITPRNFSREELGTGMSDDELVSFEKNRLRFRRMLSDIYGEDIINMESILKALGITREQIIAIAAILKFFFAPALYIR